MLQAASTTIASFLCTQAAIINSLTLNNRNVVDSIIGGAL